MRCRKMTGSKCYLSPIDPNDASIYLAWVNDEEVYKYLLVGTRSVSLDKEREILERLAKEHNYAVVDKDTDALLGNVGLFDVDDVHRSGSVGVFIGDKSYWGRGYGTEALGLLVDYSFRILNMKSLELRVFDFNERARKSYAKLGFKAVGTRRQAYFYDRRWHDEIIMDILAEDFYGRGEV